MLVVEIDAKLHGVFGGLLLFLFGGWHLIDDSRLSSEAQLGKFGFEQVLLIGESSIKG